MACYKRFKPAIIGVGIGLIIVGIFFAWRRLMPQARRSTVEYLTGRLPARVSYSKLGGNLLTGLELFDLSLHLEAGDSAQAAVISVHYNPILILKGLILGQGFELEKVELMGPRVYLAVQRPPSAPGEAKLPELTVRSLCLTDLRLWRGEEQRICGAGAQLGVKSSAEELIIRIRGDGFRFIKEGIEIESVSGYLTNVDNCWAFDDVEVIAPGSVIRFSATMEGLSEWQVAIAECRLNLAEFLGRYGVEGFAGVHGAASLKDSKGSGEIEFWAQDGRVREIAFPPLQGTINLAGPRLTGRIEAGDEAWGGLGASVELEMVSDQYSGKIRLNEFIPQGSPIAMRLSGQVEITGVIDKPEFELTASLFSSELAQIPLDSLSAELKYRNRQISGAVEAGIREGRLLISGVAAPNQFDLGYELSDFNLSLLDPVTKADFKGRARGKGRISGNPDSLNLFGNMGVEGFQFGLVQFQSLSADFALEELFMLKGQARLDAYKGRVGAQPVESLRLELDQERFRLLAVQDESSEIWAQGLIAIDPAQAIDCRITDLGAVVRGDSLLNVSEVEIARGEDDEYRVDCKRFRFCGGMGYLSARFKPAEAPWFAGELTGMDLKRLRQLLNLSEVSGWVDLQISTIGPGSHRVRLAATDFQLEPIGLKSVQGSFLIGPNQVMIDDLFWVWAADTSRVSGRLRYHREGMKFQVEDLDLSAELEDPGPWVFSFLSGIVDLKSGYISGRVSLKGSFKEPVWAGEVKIEDGELFIPSVGILAQDAQLLLQFKENQIVLAQARSRVAEGNLLGTGVATFSGFTPAWVRYRFQGYSLPLHPVDEVYALVDGDLDLKWARDQRLFLKGDFKVSQALLNFKLGAPLAAGPGPAPGPDYELRIRGERGIWLRNPDLDVEVAGDIEIKSIGGDLYILGGLETRQGKIYYLDHTLRLTQGKVYFPRSPRPDPELDIWAELDTRLETGSKEPIKILLHLSGCLSQPKFEFFSQPSILSEEDIITYLTLNRTWQELTATETQDLFYEVLSEKLLWYFQRELSEKMKGIMPLDYFRFEAGATSSSPIKVTLGKYISSDLYLSYTHNLMEPSEDIFKAEYSLGERYRILGEKTEEGRYRLQYQLRFRY